MKKRALVIALAVLPGLAMAGIAAVRAGAVAWGPDPSALPLDQRFDRGETWEEFLAGHPDRAGAWRAEYDVAGATVAALRGEAAGAGGPWRLLVVTEAWCGDSRRAVPFLARLADERDDLELRIVPKRDAPDLLAAHPHPDGREAIPLVLVLDAGYRVRGAWVEQPAALRELVARETGRIPGDQLHDRVLAWHRADAGRAVIGEVLALTR